MQTVFSPSQAPCSEVESLLACARSEEEEVRTLALTRLSAISETNPSLLVPWHQEIVEWLADPYALRLWGGITILGRIAASCNQQHIADSIASALVRALRCGKLLQAVLACEALSRLPSRWPQLAQTIVQALIEVEVRPMETIECSRILLGHAFDALSTLSHLAGPQREALISLAIRHADNPRRSTAQSATRLLAILARA